METEAKATSVNLYCEGSWVCAACSIALMAVETCSNAILALTLRHGKSPCFSRYSVYAVVGVDYALLVLASLNVEENVECAF